MSKRYSKIGQYTIMWDEVYFIAYAGGKRELTAKDQKEYSKIINLPWALQRTELKKLGNDKNPNLIPIKGLDLVGIIKEAGYMPFFDTYFSQSKTLQVNDAIVYESMKQKSYDIVTGL